MDYRSKKWSHYFPVPYPVPLFFFDTLAAHTGALRSVVNVGKLLSSTSKPSTIITGTDLKHLVELISVSTFISLPPGDSTLLLKL